MKGEKARETRVTDVEKGEESERAIDRGREREIVKKREKVSLN